MTLNTTDSKVAYAGDGSTTVFAIPFKFLADGDIEALLRDDATGAETGWTENTQYGLTGAGNDSGGTLTVETSPTDYTPQAGQTLVIRRNAAEVQGAAFPAGGAFPSATVETALDRLTMLVQQQSEVVGRALTVPATDPAGAIDLLPSSVERATRYLAFDADGKPVAAIDAGGYPASAFMATVLDDIDAAAARTTLGAAPDPVAAANVGDAAIGARALASTALMRGSLMNHGLAATVAAGALTISLRTAAGAALSTADPVYAVFRSGNTALGMPQLRRIDGASLAVADLTISSGSTLGASDATPMRLWIVLLDDNGAQRLGVINTLGAGAYIFPLGQFPFLSTTAEGEAGGADSVHVCYANVGAGGVPYAIVGYFEWTAGLPTVGTWTGPDRIQVFDAQTPLPGDTLYPRRTVYGGVATGTTTIPDDDTIPQNTEGDQYMSGGLAPTSAVNLVEVEAEANLSNSASGFVMTMALFQDSVANALAAVQESRPATTNRVAMRLRHLMQAGTTSTINFKIRAGAGAAGTTTFNGASGARKMGGAMSSFLAVREIQA